jgi:hypothetical protein
MSMKGAKSLPGGRRSRVCNFVQRTSVIHGSISLSHSIERARASSGTAQACYFDGLSEAEHAQLIIRSAQEERTHLTEVNVLAPASRFHTSIIHDVVDKPPAAIANRSRAPHLLCFRIETERHLINISAAHQDCCPGHECACCLSASGLPRGPARLNRTSIEPTPPTLLSTSPDSLTCVLRFVPRRDERHRRLCSLGCPGGDQPGYRGLPGTGHYGACRVKPSRSVDSPPCAPKLKGRLAISRPHDPVAPLHILTGTPAARENAEEVGCVMHDSGRWSCECFTQTRYLLGRCRVFDEKWRGSGENTGWRTTCHPAP